MRRMNFDGMTACSCGLPFLMRALYGNGVYRDYWCPRCDAHAQGCRDSLHPPGRCIIPEPGAKVH